MCSDTTACSLACLFFELARSPQVQEQLHAEISQHHTQMSAKPGEAVSDAVLSQLRYLGACINETLRLYPPVPSGVQRMTPPEGLRLPNTFVPGDTVIQTPTWTLHRGKPRPLLPTPGSLKAHIRTYMAETNKAGIVALLERREMFRAARRVHS